MMLLRCSRIFISLIFILGLFIDGNNAASKVEYYKSCTMANLLIATRENQHRYAYGLTVDCTFFFFEMSKYNTFELALDYHQSQHDRGIQTTFCPADMFNVRYVPQNYTPYFEVLELKAGVSHYIPMTNKSLFFTHVTPRSQGITKDWKFSPSGWATHYLYLLIHAKPHVNHRTGKSEVRTYIRHKTEKHPGACIRQSFSESHLFQFHPLIGDEADDLKNYLTNGTSIPHRQIEPSYAELYYYIIIGVLVLALLSILIGTGLIIWKVLKYYSLEKQRYEIEKFVVACYVEKLEKISKLQNPHEKPKSKHKKKKKKQTSPSESQSSHYQRHRRRGHRRSRRSYSESVSKIPHGSKILPLPNEKDLFASDKKKIEIKPAAVQEPRKERTIRRDPSKGSNTSVCSLKSVTQSLDDSLDWTGKGVRVSHRKPAFQQYKDDLTKDEDEAYKLGMNLSTLKRKKKRQQHGSSVDDEESKKTQYPLSQVSGMSSYTKPPPILVTKTATAIIAPPAMTNSKLLRGDTTALDEARFQRAEKELQDRVEAQQKLQQQQQQVKNPAGSGGDGGANVQLANNNPYGSLSVPIGPPDIFPDKKK